VGYPSLRGDLERLGRGIYCAELVDRLTPERSEGNPIFRLLQETLAILDSEESIDLAVRRFELKLLEQLGYRPSLEVCAVCDRKLEPIDNFWSAEAGGAVCPGCADDTLRRALVSMPSGPARNRGTFARRRACLSHGLYSEVEAWHSGR
jgi:DNA repair protein RecO (recombination protein O)